MMRGSSCVTDKISTGTFATTVTRRTAAFAADGYDATRLRTARGELQRVQRTNEEIARARACAS